MLTCEKLALYAQILVDFGEDSKQATAFLKQHDDDVEFTQLAEVARSLHDALTSDVVPTQEIVD